MYPLFIFFTIKFILFSIISFELVITILLLFNSLSNLFTLYLSDKHTITVLPSFIYLSNLLPIESKLPIKFSSSNELYLINVLAGDLLSKETK